MLLRLAALTVPAALAVLAGTLGVPAHPAAVEPAAAAAPVLRLGDQVIVPGVVYTGQIGRVG